MKKFKRLLSILLAIIMVVSLLPTTALATEPTTYLINCVAHNLSNDEKAGTVYIESDIDSYSGSAAFGYATENTTVTVNAVPNSGYEFIGWRKSAPASSEATVTTNASYTFTATEQVWLYAVFQKTPETWTVSVSALYSCGADYDYKTQQAVEKGQAMNPIIITANEDYYFPEDLAVQGADYGITVTRDSYTQVTVSGTPTANVNVGFSAKAKTKEETPNQLYFEATGFDTGNLCNLENGVTYSVSGAATAEFTAESSVYALSNVTAGSLNVVKKSSNPNTKFDSDAYSYTVGKCASVPNCYSTNCTDINNNNGQIWSVSTEMEYQKDGDIGWTTGTGNNVTGLTPGTYYVRYKATNINLASNSQNINIAAYNVPALTGTVEISGTTKFGEVLTATVTDSNNSGTLSYQWKRNNSSISGATSATYTISEADVGCHISVIVTSNIESGSIVSPATEIVEKAEGPSAPVGLVGVAPTVYGGSDGKIIGTATTMEYSTNPDFNDANVCPDDETAGLTSGTYYVRFKSTTTHKAGAYVTIVVPAEIKTASATINGVEAGATVGSTTVSANDNTYTATIKNWYNCDNVFDYASAAILQPTYTFTAGKTYTVCVTFTPVGDNVFSDDLDAFINGESGKIGGWDSGSRNYFITVTIPAPQLTPLGDINIQVDQPVLGSTLDYTLETTGTPPYSLAVRRWFKGGNAGVPGTVLDTNAVVEEPGVNYVLEFTIDPDDNYTINNSTVVKVNGEKAVQVSTIADTNIGVFRVTFTSPKIEIVNANAILETPLEGGNPTYSIVSSDPDKYDVAVNSWYLYEGTYPSINTYHIFEAGKSYAVRITFTAKQGYTFTDGTTYTVNGLDTSCYGLGSWREIVFKISNSWKISPTETGVYNITPSKTLPDFTKDSITVYDRQNKVVKYNDSKKGWPLIANQQYTIKINTQYDNIDDLTWNLTKKVNAIFSDVSASEWYNNAVIYAVGRGIINGYGGTTKFGPGDNIQRQDFMVILARLDGVDLTQYGNKTSAFSDVPEGSYFEAAVNWGAEKGIVNGYANGKFGTGDKITREQLVKFLYNYANYKGIDTSYKPSTKIDTKRDFDDYNQISDWALDSVLWAKENNIIKGKEKRKIVPAGNALRCEVAQIMYNLFLNDTFK